MAAPGASCRLVPPPPRAWAGVGSRGAAAVSFGLLTLLLWLLATAGPVRAAGAPGGAGRQPYDLMVLVIAPKEGPAAVVASYPEVTDHEALRQAVAELGRRARATVSQVRVRDAALTREAAAQGTDAEFSAVGLVKSGQPLPVGPIVRAMPDWRHLRLVFVVEEGFRFAGPTEVALTGFSVRLVSDQAPYEYDVERTTGRPQAAPASEPGEEEETEPPPRPRQGVLPAVMIGLPSGLLLGWLLYGWWERASARRTQGGSGSSSPPGR